MSLADYASLGNEPPKAAHRNETATADSNPKRKIRSGFSFELALTMTMPLLAIAWTALTLVACLAPSAIPGILSVRPAIIACDVMLCSVSVCCGTRIYCYFESWQRFKIRNPADLVTTLSTIEVDSATSEPVTSPDRHWWTDTPLREEVRQSVGR